MPGRPAPTPAPRKLLVSIGADASLTADRGASAILSPDGSTLAFVARQGGLARLFTRKLDQLEAAPLAGTEGAAYPFFSPDGQWIAFFASGKLKKISVTGGTAVSLCSAQNGRGGTWTDERESLASGHDTIIFSPDTASGNGLLRVSAAGGMAAPFGTLSQQAITQRWPDALPDGAAVIYTEGANSTNFNEANIVVATVPKDPKAKAGPSKVVVPGAHYGRYAPSGHLIYIKEGAWSPSRWPQARPSRPPGRRLSSVWPIGRAGSGLGRRDRKGAGWNLRVRCGARRAEIPALARAQWRRRGSGGSTHRGHELGVAIEGPEEMEVSSTGARGVDPAKSRPPAARAAGTMHAGTSMRRVTESDRIGMDEIRVLAETRFGDMIKGVVDLERGILLLDADLHADQEACLLADGSKQANLWGINLYPDVVGDDWLEFDSMINLRPSLGNRSRGVDDGGTRAAIAALIARVVRR